MSAWLEAFEELPEAQKARVKRWIHLQKLIADTLRIPFDRWIEEYVGAAMETPFDYSFMAVTVPSFQGLDVDGATFTTDVDPATARTARVPLKAKNQLGRLSPALQAHIQGLLEAEAAATEKAEPLGPSDVAQLQKMFPSEKRLARLKRNDFRRVRLTREGDAIVVSLDAGEEPLLSLDVYEFSAVMNRPLH